FRDDCGFHPRGDHLWYFSGPAVVEPAGAICSQGGSDQRLAYFAQVSSLEWPRGGADFTLARSPSLRGTLHPQPSESTAIGSGIRSKSSAAYFLRALASWLHPRDGCGVRPAGARHSANCYFTRDSSGFPALLRFFDAQSGRSFHPFHRRPGSVARSWRGPCPHCGVASAQAPDPDLESLPETISEFTRVGPGPHWLDGALGASNSSAPFRNRSEAFDTASRSQSLEQAKVPDAVLPGSPPSARPERSERRTHPCGSRNEAT